MSIGTLFTHEVVAAGGWRALAVVAQPVHAHNGGTGAGTSNDLLLLLSRVPGNLAKAVEAEVAAAAFH